MKKFVFVLLTGILCGSVKSQDWVPIACWGVNQAQIDAAPSNWEFTNVHCLESVGNVTIGGTREIHFSADSVVHLGPGFTATGITGGGIFHAYIKKGDFEPVIYHPIDSPGEVGKWKKLEIGVPLPGNLEDRIAEFIAGEPGGLNPFDPDQLRIEGDFQYMSPTHIWDTDGDRLVDGFYYRNFTRQIDVDPEDYWLEDSTDHYFRIRFAPERLGIYKCIVRIYVNGVLTYNANPFQFYCIPSDSKGPLIYGNESASDNRRRYLKYKETDEMFFAIGTSLYWKELDRLTSKDHTYYENWIQDIADNGGNYAPISALPWSFGVEWESLNNYYERMDNAWELDHVIEYAEERGIYMNLLTMIHDDLQDHTPWHENHYWSQNSYNATVNGGQTGALAPSHFFTDTDCKKFFKHRLRYLMARYGYSVNLPIVELLSEIDGVPGFEADTVFRRKTREWFTEMRTYIKD